MVCTALPSSNPWIRHTLSALGLVGLIGVAACEQSTLEPEGHQQVTEPQLMAPPALAVAVSQANTGGLIEGHWIVVFDRNVPDAPGLARRLSAQYGSAPSFVYQTALRGFSAPLPEQAVEALRRNPNVAYVEQDQVASSIGTQTNPTWGLDRIDQRQRPLDGSYTFDNEGSGVSAYIIDTGIRTTHNEFGGRATFTADFVGDGNEDVNFGDCGGHGTHVAGTVGGATYGVAKQVSLHALRVLNCDGNGSYSGVIAAIDWVAANGARPAVANLSLGGPASASVNQAIENAVQAGVAFAVSAGNDNSDACTKSPASAPSALTVGASTVSDSRSGFSNFGTCVDVFAPGSSIRSSTNGTDSSTGTWSGTSMASPHVAGAIALLLGDDASLTPSQITSLIELNGTTGELSGIGSGSPNLLLYSRLGGSPPPPPPPPPSDTEVHVDAVSVSVSFGRKNANGTATVRIVDASGTAVPSATVVGDWRVDGVLTKSNSSGVTNTSGLASIGSGGMRRVRDTQTVEFCVTDVSGPGLVYDAAANTDECDSDGGATPPPTGFTLKAEVIKGGNQVRLTWSGSNASSFAIARDSLSLGTTGATSLVDNPPGGTWTYEVCEVPGMCLEATVTTRR